VLQIHSPKLAGHVPAGGVQVLVKVELPKQLPPHEAPAQVPVQVCCPFAHTDHTPLVHVQVPETGLPHPPLDDDELDELLLELELLPLEEEELIPPLDELLLELELLDEELEVGAHLD